MGFRVGLLKNTDFGSICLDVSTLSAVWLIKLDYFPTGHFTVQEI